MAHEPKSRRRRFLRQAAGGMMSLPITAVVGTRVARSDGERLDPQSQQAQALNYVHDASEAGSGRSEGAICGNCTHWTGGDAQWGGCNIFPGKQVNRDGWCSAWVEA